MRETRVKPGDIKPGELVVRVLGRVAREYNGVFKGLREVPAGTTVWGPRGGKYRLTAEGAHQYVVVQTTAGNPLVKRSGTVVVMREELEIETEHRINGHVDSSGNEHQTAECPLCVKQSQR